MDYNLMDALELLEREKGVPRDTILEALANALVSAYKRQPGAAEEARVTIDADTGEIMVYGQELDEDGLMEFAKSKITPFKAPSQVKFVDGLPKSLVGKVLKKELRKMV